MASGEPAILLPGGPCRGVEYLGDFAGVGADRPLVVLHPRGTPTSGGLSRGWWADAADVIAVADALGLDRFDLVAHSAGTRLALATAAQHGRRVRSLALITPPASWLSGTPTDAPEVAERLAEGPALAGLAELVAEVEPQSESEYREVFARQAPASYAHWGAIEQAHAQLGAVSLAAALAWFNGIPDTAAEQIRAMPARPTLVIGGDRDLLTGVQPVRDYATVLGAEAEFVTSCGHYPWVEHPIDFRELLGPWLINVRT